MRLSNLKFIGEYVIFNGRSAAFFTVQEEYKTLWLRRKRKRIIAYMTHEEDIIEYEWRFADTGEGVENKYLDRIIFQERSQEALLKREKKGSTETQNNVVKLRAVDGARKNK